MAVYREGFMIAEKIEKLSIQIYPDACDYGVPVKKGDEIWNLAGQMAEMYGDKDSRFTYRTDTCRQVAINVDLINEWAVSDHVKTVEEATDTYRLEFVSCTDGACKGYEGFICFYKRDY